MNLLRTFFVKKPYLIDILTRCLYEMHLYSFFAYSSSLLLFVPSQTEVLNVDELKSIRKLGFTIFPIVINNPGKRSPSPACPRLSPLSSPPHVLEHPFRTIDRTPSEEGVSPSSNQAAVMADMHGLPSKTISSPLMDVPLSNAVSSGADAYSFPSMLSPTISDSRGKKYPPKTSLQKRPPSSSAGPSGGRKASRHDDDIDCIVVYLCELDRDPGRMNIEKITALELPKSNILKNLKEGKSVIIACEYASNFNRGELMYVCYRGDAVIKRKRQLDGGNEA